MKRKIVLILVATFGILIVTNSCKAPKNVEKATGATEVSLPLSGKEYQSDKDNFRAKQSGKSPDLATAKKIALQNAKSELAGNIQSVVKRVTDQYTNQRTVGNKQDFENKFEELAREVVNQTLSDVKIIGEKVYKETDNTYTYWVAIEDSKSAVLAGIDKKISKDDKLQLDYDKKKFEDIFNAEMEKMKNDK